MKLQLTLLFLFTFSILFANDKTTPSTIEKVTVYLEGAQITRQANIKIPKGTSVYMFSNLSPFIDESSIQISGLKQASVLSIDYGINYLLKQEKTKEIEILQQQLEIAEDDIELEKHRISGYEEELQLIKTNRSLGNDNEVVNLDKLKAFALYYRERITKIKTNIFKTNKAIKTLQITINNLNKQLIELNADEKEETGEIIIKLDNEKPSTLNLVLKYNVSNAGWFPVYDLRAKNINSPINLIYKAHVYQSTGQVWKNIKLSLSTGDPNTNNIKPDINPKYLNFINRYSNYRNKRAAKRYNYKYNPLVKIVSGTVLDESGLPLPGATVLEKGTTNGTTTDFDGRYTLKLTGHSREIVISYVGYANETIPIYASTINTSLEADNMLEEVVVTAYGISSGKQHKKNQEDKEYISTENIIEEGITNVSFKINKPYTISSNNDIIAIPINTFLIPATYAYFAAPLLNENVFLISKLTNWEQYNLLAGEANVYFEGNYSGKTEINPSTTTDSLTISLGVDPNVVINRTQINNYKKKSFIGNNRIINKTYEIEVKNNKSSEINLDLYDRIPISQNKEIKVDDIDKGDAEYDSKKGILKWKLKLPAKQHDKKAFSYTVKFPKYRTVNL